MNQIAVNRVVSLEYKLHTGDGKIIDQTSGDFPTLYLHGRGEIVPGLEKRLEGIAVGHTGTIIVPPEEAYGERDPEGVREVARENFPPRAELIPGEQVLAQSDTGEVFPITIVEVRGQTVVIDFNHPLAGKTLHFDVSIKEIREATEDELMNGLARQGGCCGGGGGCGCGAGGGCGGGGGGCGCGAGGCGDMGGCGCGAGGCGDPRAAAMGGGCGCGCA